ncbi:MAG: class I SAM-dependent methyltransferase [Candidatus Aminicenantes bacterium]|nr:class I SAM-dependent methyltransferase [Candidatus Aminicenantes bacterium]
MLSPEKIKITDADYGLTWDLSRCLDCSFVFANPCPEEKFITSLYSEVKDPAYEVEALGRRQTFRRLLHRLEKLRPQRGYLLDVGAATGLFLDEAKKRGWQVLGIEPSRWAVEIAQKQGLKVFQGSLEDFKIDDQRYDVITLIDVLEHTPNPRKIVEKVQKLLKPQGLILIVTPDLESFLAKLTGRYWWHYRPAHLVFFNRQSLKKLLALTHFEVLSWKRYSWHFSLSYLFSRLPFTFWLLHKPFLSSLWSRIQLKLALGDSFEVYAQKKERA